MAQGSQRGIWVLDCSGEGVLNASILPKEGAPSKARGWVPGDKPFRPEAAGGALRKPLHPLMTSSVSEQLMSQVIQLYPSYLTDPLDVQWNHGNAAAAIVEPDGAVRGHIFGDNRETGQRCFQIATRKVLQVWRTGYATGRFEELVYSGKLDEGTFGLQRPDLIGWEGGVPIVGADGGLIAAAFSGFRGIKDVEILERAAHAVGLRLKKA